MENISKYFAIISLLLISACSNVENKNVDLDDAKNNPLLIPPCVKK